MIKTFSVLFLCILLPIHASTSAKPEEQKADHSAFYVTVTALGVLATGVTAVVLNRNNRGKRTGTIEEGGGTRATQQVTAKNTFKVPQASTMASSQALERPPETATETGRPQVTQTEGDGKQTYAGATQANTDVQKEAQATEAQEETTQTTEAKNGRTHKGVQEAQQHGREGTHESKGKHSKGRRSSSGGANSYVPSKPPGKDNYMKPTTAKPARI